VTVSIPKISNKFTRFESNTEVTIRYGGD